MAHVLLLFGHCMLLLTYYRTATLALYSVLLSWRQYSIVVVQAIVWECYVANIWHCYHRHVTYNQTLWYCYLESV